MHYAFIHATQESLIPLVGDSAIDCSANRIPEFGSVVALEKTKSFMNITPRERQQITTRSTISPPELALADKMACSEGLLDKNRYSCSFSRLSSDSPKKSAIGGSHCQLFRAQSSYPVLVKGDPLFLEPGTTLTSKDLEESDVDSEDSLEQMEAEVVMHNSKKSIITPALDPKSMGSLLSRGTIKIDTSSVHDQTYPSDKHLTHDNLKIDTIIDFEEVLARIPSLNQYMAEKEKDLNGSSRIPLRLKSQKSSFGK